MEKFGTLILRQFFNSPLGRLSGEHDAVGTVENGVGDVPRLRPRGPRLLHHRLQHLGRANDRLSCPAISLPLLCKYKESPKQCCGGFPALKYPFRYASIRSVPNSVADPDPSVPYLVCFRASWIRIC